MSECQMCHSEDSTFNRFCKDCWIEMIREAKSAGLKGLTEEVTRLATQDFNEYWEIDDE